MVPSVALAIQQSMVRLFVVLLLLLFFFCFVLWQALHHLFTEAEQSSEKRNFLQTIPYTMQPSWLRPQAFSPKVNKT